MNRSLGHPRVAALAVAVLGISSIAGTRIGTDGSLAAAADRPPLVAFLMAARGGAFGATLACGAQREAADQGVADGLVIIRAGWDPRAQTQMLEDAIAAGAEVLILQPAHPRLMVAGTEAALAAGVPVVLADTGLRPSAGVSSLVTSDNERAGREAARVLADSITHKGVILAITRLGPTTTEDRSRGFRDELSSLLPDAAIVEVSAPRGFQPAMESVEAALSVHPDVAGVFAANGGLVAPAAAALEAVGRTHVPIVGMDAGPSQVRALDEGSVRALIAQDPYGMGAAAMREALAARDGRGVQGEVLTEIAILDPDNVEDPSVSRFLYQPEC